MKYALTCTWCAKSFLSFYAKESICLECDCMLIERTHPIYSSTQAQELVLNGSYTTVVSIIDKSETFQEALQALYKKCSEDLNIF